ncbi:MAG: hypothetical protein BA869_08415 [Desulfuromonadales bacterium C00003107]|jgi:hypothetical protein|nr:MAG: hypothetical protein BA869_08415 [Desulfuromonadales bacterium C00003107]
MTSNHNFELIVVDEFAKRMGVGRTTVFKWKDENIVVQGEHYFSIGKVLRFLWSKETIVSLVKRNTPIKQDLAPPIVPRYLQKKSQQGSRINLDLC